MIAAMSFSPLHAVPSAAFHASFDQDFSAVSKTGYVAGKHSAEILYENLATYLKDGVNGTGALIGTGNEKREDYHIEYPNHDFITPEQGSVVFWVRPENWQGNDRNFHIFSVRMERMRICLYIRLHGIPNCIFSSVRRKIRRKTGLDNHIRADWAMAAR